MKLTNIEKAVLKCKSGKNTVCEECAFDYCNKESFLLVLESANKKQYENKKDKELLNKAKQYYNNLEYNIIWSRSYKKYLLVKGYEEIFKSKALLISDYIINTR